MNRTHIAVQLRAIAAHAEYAESRMLDTSSYLADSIGSLALRSVTEDTIIHLRELLDSIERELNRP